MNKENAALKQQLAKVQKENSELKQQNEIYQHSFDARMEERLVFIYPSVQ